MRYAMVLVEISDDEEALRRAGFAAVLAERFGAGLVGVMACRPESPTVEPNATSGMVAELLELQRDISRCEIKLAEQRFRAIAGTRIERVSFAGYLGAATDAIVGHARAVDLVVIGQNKEAETSGGAADPQALLERCGRPLLVLPAGADASLPETVVVAWRDCCETRRAIRDALPLLQAARRVVVAQACESDSLAAARIETGDVADYLGRHGIRAQPAAFHAERRHAPVELEGFARSEGAGLIVAGGFARCRLLDQALPDETERMLTSCGIPCLLSA